METEEALAALVMDKFQLSPAKARLEAEIMNANPDIMDEFIAVVTSGCFPDDDMAIRVEGLTAAEIKAHFGYFNYLGVYNYLIRLRNNSNEALRYLQKNRQVYKRYNQ